MTQAVYLGKKPRKVDYIEVSGYFRDFQSASEIADKIESARVIKISDGGWEVIKK